MFDQLFNHKFTFLNIIPYSYGEEEKLAAEAIEYYQQTGYEAVLYSLTLQPSEVPAIRKAEIMLESYRKLKAHLEGTGVRLGVLFQSVLGHRYWADKDMEPWQRTINIEGDVKRFCILDENFRKFIFDMTVMFARENPCFIMGDDDIRSFSPLVECFCPLHTAEFNRRTGNNFTPDQYREAVKNCKIGDAIYTEFEKIRQEITNGTAAIIREAIDTVNPAIPAGSCMPGWEFRFNGDTAKIFSGGHHPAVMRICNANYNELSAKQFPLLIARSQALRLAHSDIPYILDESDTCPHNLYSRSARSMHAKLCAVALSGFKGSKIWLVNTHKNGFPVHRNYTKVMAQHRNYYDKLVELAENYSMSGVLIPCHSHFPNWHPADPEKVREFFLERPSIADNVLGRIGIPFRCTNDLSEKGVYAIAGKEHIDRFTDDELRKLLSGRLILDGKAAAAVCARGFARELGANVTMDEICFNREVHVKTGQVYPIGKVPGVPKIEVIEKDVEIVTELWFTPYKGSPIVEKAAPGVIICSNHLGGKVCTMAYHPDITFCQYNEPRKHLFQEIIDKLADDSSTLYCQDYQDITVMSMEGGDSRIAAVCNINFDPMSDITLRSGSAVTKVEFLTPEGIWEPAEFTLSGSNVTIAHELACYEFAVFRLS